MTEDQTNQLLVYGRPGCPMVPPVRTYLDEAGIAYTYRDIRQDADAAVQLRKLANGFESVPTVVLPNGRVLVEPGVARLRQALKELGEAGGEMGDPGLGGTLKAGLSNPVYPVLLLIALALAVAIALASG